MSEWQLWCRLCADRNSDCYTNAFHDEALKAVNPNMTLVEVIEKCFSVKITPEDDFPKVLCSQCLRLIKDIVDFSERVIKAQEIYNELIYNTKQNSQMNIDMNVDTLVTKKSGLTTGKQSPTCSSIISKVSSVNIKNEPEEEEEQSIEKIAELEADEHVYEPNPDQKDGSCCDSDPFSSIEDNGNQKDGENRSNIDVILNIECNECAKEFESFDSYREHLKLMHGKGKSRDKWQCPKCDKTITTTFFFKRHLIDIHFGQKSQKIRQEMSRELLDKGRDINLEISCNDCGQQFETFHSYRRHLKSVHSKGKAREKWDCPKCNKTVTTSFNFRRHLLSHVGQKSDSKHREKIQLPDIKVDISCRECAGQFNSFQCYRQHLRLAHDKGRARENWCCPLCDITVSTSYSFRRHLMTHIPDKERRTHPCSLCSKSFVTYSELRIHLFRHKPLEERNVIPCPHCAKRFSTNKLLQTHIKCMHLNERQKRVTTKKYQDEKHVVCEECGMCLRNKTNLKIHMQRHSDNAPFECEICKKRFKNPRRLKIHSEIHDSHKHVCTICGQQLNTRNTLKRHMLVHNGKKQQKCDYCGQGFNHSTNLKIHLLSHTGLKPYACNFCDRTFTNGANCRLHKKKMHPEELAALEAAGGSKHIVQKIPTLETLKALYEKLFLKKFDKILRIIKKPLCNGKMSEWQLWCRLCADRNSECYTSAFHCEALKAANPNMILVQFIEKCFSVKITPEDDLPKVVCSECLRLINSIIHFSERVIKVQEMFNHLIYDAKQSQLNIDVNDAKFQPEKSTITAGEQSPTYSRISEASIHIKDEPEGEEDKNIDEIRGLVREEHVYEPNADPKDSSCCGSDLFSSMEEKKFNHLRNQREDKNIVIQDVIASIECNECAKEFESFDSYDEHLRLIHSKRNSKDLHFDEKPHKIKNRRSRGLQAKAGDISLNMSCNDCGQQFETFHAYKEHLKSMHGKGKAREKWDCPLCDVIVQNSYSFRRHLMSHISDKEQRTHSCSLCDKSFETYSGMRIHLSAHEPPGERNLIPCPHCDKYFSSNELLQAHIQCMHVNWRRKRVTTKKFQDEKHFVCEECGLCLRNKTNLKIHMQRHSDNAPFECEICKKRFKNSRRLKIHSEIHDSQKHVCNVCGQELNTRNTLKQHMLVHTGNKQHKCDYCGQGFHSSSTLKRHLISHTGLKPYACNFCDRTFTNRTNFRVHKEKKHPGELAALEAAGVGKHIAQKLPTLETLKALTKAASNLKPVAKPRD
ncbi:zinc finger protein 729-like [Glossina fuscipes]|uniref:Zinc finger protein 729-like n=1 Tax=Glossina fuscipes TaxID=7396 RepID=A0A8U0W9D3_9MUSC|nr:zinc finger protein 729-like [Glossina fuscipes]